MKNLKLISLLVLSFSMLQSCEEDIDTDAQTATFFITMHNSPSDCNEAGIAFTFLFTHPDGRQFDETVTAGNTEVIDSAITFANKDLLNVKIFVASSEEAISEANIEFNYNNRSDNELMPDNNAVNVTYCHEANNATITWDIRY